MRRPLAALSLLLSLGCHAQDPVSSVAPEEQPRAQLASLDTPPDPIAYDDASPGLRRDVIWDWEQQLEAEVEQQAVEQRAQTHCVAPDPDEIAVAKRSLAGFLIFDASKQGLRAREPSKAELADLAYLFAALDHPGAVVGSVEEGTASCEQGREREALEVVRQGWQEAAERADYEGDVQGAIAAREGFLSTYGYPEALTRCGSTQRVWGGTNLDYAMRELAVLLEHEGRFEQAEGLYREARPGGGICGSSTHLRVVEQLMGVIRTGEQARGCRAVLPERLSNIEYAESYHPFDYGPGPLADAGFNLARLYRAALLTANREVGLDELAQAVRDSSLAPALQNQALGRLELHGTEAWAGRVRAIEGLVSVNGRLAVPELLTALDRLGPQGRARVVAAIGELGERRKPGECDPHTYFSSRRARVFRPVPSLGQSCATSLSDHEADQLAALLEPSLDDPESVVRAQTAHALRKLLSPASLPRLGELARSDSFISPDEFYCEDASGDSWWGDDPDDPDCRELYPVREAAAEAVDWISGGWDWGSSP